eukprot:CFRG5605T1
MTEFLNSFELNQGRFLALLEKLINSAGSVQNNPSQGLVPKEEIMADYVLEALNPYLKENGGVIEAKKITYTEGRSNLVIKYPGTTDRPVSLVGSHFDVVPANPDVWKRNPFKFELEGDKMWGRGTTDCLGHVALITTIFGQMAEENIKLDISVYAVFIASEECPTPNVGVDVMLENGELEMIKSGPVVWCDASDSQPCLGTASTFVWHITATGKLYHSGFPNKTVNAAELAMDTVHAMQDHFYKKFPPHTQEEKFRFSSPSSLKPTQMSLPGHGSFNQIPELARISGDCRLSPFYEIENAMEEMNKFVEDLNRNLESVPGRGPSSYKVDGIDSSIAISIDSPFMRGVYVDVESPGYKALSSAVESVRGELKPYSVCGSLPLVGDLKKGGLDLQMIGFGLVATYHANDEYALLSDFLDGGKVLARFLAKMNVS